MNKSLITATNKVFLLETYPEFWLLIIIDFEKFLKSCKEIGCIIISNQQEKRFRLQIYKAIFPL